MLVLCHSSTVTETRELRNRAETGGSAESELPSLSQPIPVHGNAELTETATEHDIVLVDFYADW